MSLILENVSKSYGTGNIKVDALKNVSFEIKEKEFVVILGSSGAGKTTLLNVLGGMDNLSSGSYKLDDIEVSKFNQKELALFRRKTIGFVFQFYNLMPNLTSLENVELSRSIVNTNISSKEALKLVGLEHRLYNFPSQLSGGEQQRVAIARAIVKDPKVLLCDEPTGALDSKTGLNIIKLLYEISKQGKTVIIVTHNQKLAEIATRLIRIQDGQIIENKVQVPKNIEDIDW